MDVWLVFRISIIILNFQAFLNVTERNQLKYLSNKAYERKDYSQATKLYDSLAGMTFLLSPEIRLNRAHAYYFSNKKIKALADFKRLATSSDTAISTSSFLGIAKIALEKKDTSAAIDYLKNGLQKNENNRLLRGNLEWLLGIYNNKQRNQTSAKYLNTSQVQIVSSTLHDMQLEKPANQAGLEQTLEILNALQNSDIENLKKIRKYTSKKTLKNW